MADKNCLGCGEEEAKFRLTVRDGTEEHFCADCMGHLFLEVSDCILKVEAI